MKLLLFILVGVLCNTFTLSSRCRQDVVFPFVSCGNTCGWHSYQSIWQCFQKAQFGCRLQWCAWNGFQCAGDPSNPAVCPNNEIPVEEVALVPHRPVEFILAFNLSEYMIDVIFLLDASASARPSLDALKNDLIRLIRNVSSTYNVGVGIYGSEQFFGAAGYSVLQAVTTNSEAAVQALHNIPTLSDGPRSSIQALAALFGLRTVEGGMPDFGFRSRERIFFLIGDTPGREVACDATSFSDIRWELKYRRGSNRLITASIGKPGLNAAIDAGGCANGSIGEALKPIAGGQGAAISVRGGQVGSPVQFDSLHASYAQVRSYPPRGYLPGWGRVVTVTQNTTARAFGYAQMVGPVAQSDGCNERVLLSIADGWAFPLQLPTRRTGRVRLALAPVACRNGSFSCEVVIRDWRRNVMGTPSSRNVDGHVHIVKVNACGYAGTL